jgi:hypothetical protein
VRLSTDSSRTVSNVKSRMGDAVGQCESGHLQEDCLPILYTNSDTVSYRHVLLSTFILLCLVVYFGVYAMFESSIHEAKAEVFDAGEKRHRVVYYRIDAVWLYSTSSQQSSNVIHDRGQDYTEEFNDRAIKLRVVGHISIGTTLFIIFCTLWYMMQMSILRKSRDTRRPQ